MNRTILKARTMCTRSSVHELYIGKFGLSSKEVVKKRRTDQKRDSSNS